MNAFFALAGTIDPLELKAAMESLGYAKTNKVVYKMLDKIPETPLGFDAFLELMTTRISSGDSREEMEKVFRLFDERNAGYITLEDLTRIASELGETISQVVCTRILSLHINSSKIWNDCIDAWPWIVLFSIFE